MQFLRIISLTVLLSLAAAVLRDLVLIQVSFDFFTFGRPDLFGTDSPFLIAAGWALLSTGWMAVPYGLGLACAARLGSRPKRAARDLRKPVLLLLGLIAGFALAAGIFGYVLGSMGTVILKPDVKEGLPAQKWPGFQACWFVHTMGNFVGCIGGGMQIAYVWVSRKRLVRKSGKTQPGQGSHRSKAG